MSDVTQILSKIESGDQKASEELLPLVYNELRRLAAARMANERGDHTLSATALVHEAYVRLVNVEQVQKWDSRRHLYWSAAEAMRRILVEHARRKLGKQRGGDLRKIELDNLELADEHDATRILEIEEALEQLEKDDRQVADLIKLRFFSGIFIFSQAGAEKPHGQLPFVGVLFDEFDHRFTFLSGYPVESGTADVTRINSTTSAFVAVSENWSQRERTARNASFRTGITLAQKITRDVNSKFLGRPCGICDQWYVTTLGEPHRALPDVGGFDTFRRNRRTESHHLTP